MRHPTTTALRSRLRLPVIGSPMFIISCPDLVIAQCKAGIVGSVPALNARPQSLLDDWLHRIAEELAEHDAANPDRPSAPFAVNQIVHLSNYQLDAARPEQRSVRTACVDTCGSRWYPPH